MTPLAPERYKIQFTATRATHDKLRRAQELLRHAIPSGDPAEIVRPGGSGRAVGYQGRRDSQSLRACGLAAPYLAAVASGLTDGVELWPVEHGTFLTDRDEPAVWRWHSVKNTIRISEPRASSASRDEQTCEPDGSESRHTVGILPNPTGPPCAQR